MHSQLSQENLEKLADIRIDGPFEIRHVRARELLTTKNYIDILAKYLYAKAREDGTLTPWMNSLYIRYLLTHNKLFDGSSRATGGAFLKSFHEVLDSIKADGFMAERSVVPVNEDMDLLGGSHRTAAALLHDMEVTIVQVQRGGDTWDVDSFKKRGYATEFLDAIALEYCILNPQNRLALIFPIVREHYAAVREKLAKHTICYEKDITLTRTGIGNLIAQMYKPKEWLNVRTREIHANRRYVAGKPIHVLVLQPESTEALLTTKAEIRTMFDHENLPIHTSDDQEETIRVAQQLFTANSIHFFNYANPTKFTKFQELFDEYKNWLHTNSYPSDEFCIDSGAVLAACGLRDCNDFDYLSFRNTQCPLTNINSHNQFSYLHEKTLAETIFDPSNYFYYDGYKFITPSLLRKMKQRRRDPQDARDCNLIDTLPLNASQDKNKQSFFSIENIWNSFIIAGSRLIWRTYILCPKKCRPLILHVYHLLKWLYHCVRRMLWKY